MEKIQKALAKARDSREGGTPSTPRERTAPAPARGPQVQHDGDPWSLLQKFHPDEARLIQSRIMTLHTGQAATHFDVMRTKTLQTMRANNWRRLAITSPSPSAGKSTIALNLAFSIARQPDLRAILAELDLRRPSIGKTLNITPPHGIADVLRGRVDFADQALCHNDNMAFSLSKGSVGNTAELLNSAEIVNQLADIEARFAPDVMIFDMPPMLVNDDMMAFAGQVDCVLLVAAAETTTVKEIDTCERELASQTNVMGVALNKCRYMGPDYGYSYYS
ncbi:CpsD/CapB family tyrosine-protein kinase [Primorskyibacter sp. S187A]|uniref:CpsD/CapB family tyrosine-protein kinase n=1 Tax=Primorskyibacter sp. S187A TaxID=3415130 RepID=UPI003C7A6699